MTDLNDLRRVEHVRPGEPAWANVAPHLHPATVEDLIEVFKNLGAYTINFPPGKPSEGPGRYLVWRLPE